MKTLVSAGMENTRKTPMLRYLGWLVVLSLLWGEGAEAASRSTGFDVDTFSDVNQAGEIRFEGTNYSRVRNGRYELVQVTRYVPISRRKRDEVSSLLVARRPREQTRERALRLEDYLELGDAQSTVIQRRQNFLVRFSAVTDSQKGRSVGFVYLGRVRGEVAIVEVRYTLYSLDQNGRVSRYAIDQFVRAHSSNLSQTLRQYPSYH